MNERRNSGARERAHLRIRGRVQGVCYRASTEDQALRLGLRGWVRNRRDGSVEAVAEGPTAAIDAFVAWCRQGPPAARVSDVEIVSRGEPPTDDPLVGFRMRLTE